MSDVVIGTLRLRGPHASRLARVAATTLPAALDAALAGYPDGRVQVVCVPFPVDAGLDDGTLAALWAEAIRAAVHDTLVAGATGRASTAAPDPATGASAPTAADAVRAALAWVAGGARADAVPRQAWRVADPVLVDECRALLAGRWAEVVSALARSVRQAVASGARTGPADHADRHGGGSVETAGADRAGDGTATAGEDAPRPGPTATDPLTEPPTARGSTGSPGEKARVAADLALVSEVGDLVDETTSAVVDTAHLTTAAGLALLYPWLADHCRAAVVLHPQVPAARVRAEALALLVSAQDPPRDDPLVRLLAGYGRGAGEAGPDLPMSGGVNLRRLDEVDQSAQEVLRHFAALLPGFEGSSADFVRREWVSRTGLLDDRIDHVRLSAAARPLDVVLGALPYPLGLLALPWCRPISVRWQR